MLSVKPSSANTFERHEFLVRQGANTSPRPSAEDDIDFVLNRSPPKREGDQPFVLASEDLKHIERAIVVVKGWHTETFSLGATGEHAGDFPLCRNESFQRAAKSVRRKWFAAENSSSPPCPTRQKSATRALPCSRAKGVDAVIPSHHARRPRRPD